MHDMIREYGENARTRHAYAYTYNSSYSNLVVTLSTFVVYSSIKPTRGPPATPSPHRVADYLPACLPAWLFGGLPASLLPCLLASLLARLLGLWAPSRLRLFGCVHKCPCEALFFFDSRDGHSRCPGLCFVRPRRFEPVLARHFLRGFSELLPATEKNWARGPR